MMKRIKKMVSILMAVIVVMGVYTIPVNASSDYTDISSSDSCYNAAIYLRDHNIMVGYTETTFGKTGNLIRADVVTILWRMLNSPEPYGMISSFPDCDSSAYYYKAVQWACSESVGIASGYENGNFGPTDLVSNQDLLTFIYRFACYCGYETNTSTNQGNYLTYFNRSALTNKSTFWNYSKVPVGWAYHNDFITNNNIQGTIFATRGETAEYIYHFYQSFQRKYGLTIINTNNLEWAWTNETTMQKLFDRNNIIGIAKANIEEGDFSSAMNDAFGNAKRLDICYLYLNGHGSNEGSIGIQLFSDEGFLSPRELRTAIERFNDCAFIVLLDTCYAGVYITNSISSENTLLSESEIEELTEEFLNEFINGLVVLETNNAENSDLMVLNFSDLRGSNRIKVLGASYANELSYWGNKCATDGWSHGAGYDRVSQTNIDYLSDDNGDNRVSLFELYYYSYYYVLEENPQHIIHYPYGDEYIIFEDSF